MALFLILVGFLQGQEKDTSSAKTEEKRRHSEEVYKRVEDQLLRAKSVKADFTVDLGLKGEGQGRRAQVSLTVKEPNLVRLIMKGDALDQPEEAYVLCDGKTLILKKVDWSASKQVVPPADLASLVKLSLLRAGYPGFDCLIDQLVKTRKGDDPKIDAKAFLKIDRVISKEPGDAGWDLLLWVTMQGSNRPGQEPVYHDTARVCLRANLDQMTMEKRETSATNGDFYQVFSEEYKSFALNSDVSDQSFALPQKK